MFNLFYCIFYFVFFIVIISLSLFSIKYEHWIKRMSFCTVFLVNHCKLPEMFHYQHNRMGPSLRPCTTSLMIWLRERAHAKERQKNAIGQYAFLNLFSIVNPIARALSLSLSLSLSLFRYRSQTKSWRTVRKGKIPQRKSGTTQLIKSTCFLVLSNRPVNLWERESMLDSFASLCKCQKRSNGFQERQFHETH